MPTKDRQRRLAREKVQRQMARRAAMARQRRRRQAISGVVVAVLAVGALGVAGAIKVRNAHLKASTTTCSYTTSPAGSGGTVPRKAKLPQRKLVKKKGTVQVELTTNQGQLRLTLDRAKAPCTVNSFVSLIQQKYFDKTPCHRVTSQGSFVLQCGDPGGTGAGGPGYAFPDEHLPLSSGSTVVYRKGTLAMANAGPGTNGSQFFVVYNDSSFPPSYSVFGRLSAGLSVVEKIAAAGSTPKGDGKPKIPVTIESAKLLA